MAIDDCDERLWEIDERRHEPGQGIKSIIQGILDKKIKNNEGYIKMYIILNYIIQKEFLSFYSYYDKK